MVSGMLDGVIKQMVNKFPCADTDKLMAGMRGTPQGSQLFAMMKSIGITEDKLKKMIGDQIVIRDRR